MRFRSFTSDVFPEKPFAEIEYDGLTTNVMPPSVTRANEKQVTDLTRQEVDAKLAQNKAEVDARLANFDTSIKTGFADLATAMAQQSAAMDRQTDALRIEMAQMRTEMAKQTGEMRTEMAQVRTDSHKGTIEITRWVVGFGLAILGSIFAMSRMDKPASTPAQPPAPIIYTLPAGSTVLSAPQAPAATASPPAKQSN